MRIAPMLLLFAAGLSMAAGSPSKGTSTRVQEFAKLPDWRGIWLSAAWPLDVSGRIPGGELKLRQGLQLIQKPPYNAEWMAKYDAGTSNTAEMTARTANFTACTRSFPALMEAPWMFQLVVLPEETLILFENGQVRRVYTDGRPHPSANDLWPTKLGDSIGRWEGSTLHIETVARLASEPITLRAWFSLLSDQARLLEQMRLIDSDTLEDELTIVDPIALATEWHVTLRFVKQKAMSRVIEYNCTENDRNPLVDGKLTITHP